MVMENIFGLMEEAFRDSGFMVNDLEKVWWLLQREKLNMESGKMITEWIGLTKSTIVKLTKLMIGKKCKSGEEHLSHLLKILIKIVFAKLDSSQKIDQKFFRQKDEYWEFDTFKLRKGSKYNTRLIFAFWYLFLALSICW